MNRIARLALMIFLATVTLLVIPSTAHAASTSACTSHKVVKTTGARTVTTETKDCTKDRGGYSHSTRTETCTKAKAGKSCASVRVTDSRSVSEKGNVTDTHTVTRCTKSAQKASVCTTDSTTASTSK